MTTPYVTGTVSVTAGSAVVTGTGTGWQTSGLIAGEFGVDGLSVPVLSIDSNTKITLAQPWPGATASGKAYWISYDTTPGQQTVANAMRLAEYIARLDKPALAALASLVPAADKLPYFGAGGAGALFDFTAAARALLSGTGVLPDAQIPTKMSAKEISNLVVRQGAAGANGYLNLFSGDATHAGYVAMYQKDGSRAGYIGYPDAATKSLYLAAESGNYWNFDGPLFPRINNLPIVEKGANANGQYTRFADGTQICWADRKFTGDDSTIRYIALWTFPAAFAPSFRPVVSHTVNQNTLIDAGNNTTQRTAIFAPSLLNLNSTGVELNMTTGIAWSNYTSVVTHAMAMGRWY